MRLERVAAIPRMAMAIIMTNVDVRAWRMTTEESRNFSTVALAPRVPLVGNPDRVLSPGKCH